MSKNNNRKSKAQIDWHSGFAGGGEDQTMCEALKELMADELKQAKEDGVSEATKKFATIINEKDKTIIDQDKTISEQDKTISEQEALLKQYKEKFGEL